MIVGQTRISCLYPEGVKPHSPGLRTRNPGKNPKRPMVPGRGRASKVQEEVNFHGVSSCPGLTCQLTTGWPADQECEKIDVTLRETTLGHLGSPAPKGLNKETLAPYLTPSALRGKNSRSLLPRVASTQPWAIGCNPFGVKENAIQSQTKLSTIGRCPGLHCFALSVRKTNAQLQ